jgi:hypothetical protein
MVNAFVISMIGHGAAGEIPSQYLNATTPSEFPIERIGFINK